MNDWYHVWETHVDVAGYDMTSTVDATWDEDGEPNELTTKHPGRSTAFQFTKDTKVTFTNTYTPNTFTATKVDAADTDVALADAEFYLTNKDGAYYSYDGETGKTAWLNSSDGAVPGGSTLLTSDSNGQFTFHGIADGTYYLKEMAAPDGYQLPTGDFTLVVSNGSIISAGDEAYAVDQKAKSFIIKNTTGTELPETGGSGSTPLILGGLLLVAAAGCGYGLRRRHEGRGARS